MSHGEAIAVLSVLDDCSCTNVTQQYNWPAYCQKYGITPKILKAIALEIGLPLAQLGDRQSKMLLSELEKRFATIEVEVELRSLF